MKRVIITLFIILLLLVGAIALTPSAILGGTRVFTLHPAAALTGQISQALAAQTDRPTLLVAGKDYTLQNTQYFDGTWVVTTVVPTNGGDSGTVVLKKQDGIYVVALGPGASFPQSYTESLPSDVVLYLNQEGVF